MVHRHSVSGAASTAAVGAARLRRQRDQRHDVLSRHAEGLHDQRGVLLEAPLPADRRRRSPLPDGVARRVEDGNWNRHARSRARDRRRGPCLLRGRHVLRPHAAISWELVLMSLGWSVVLFNFGVIIVVYLIGRLIDAAAERYDLIRDSKKD